MAYYWTKFLMFFKYFDHDGRAVVGSTEVKFHGSTSLLNGSH